MRPGLTELMRDASYAKIVRDATTRRMVGNSGATSIDRRGDSRSAVSLYSIRSCGFLVHYRHEDCVPVRVGRPCCGSRNHDLSIRSARSGRDILSGPLPASELGVHSRCGQHARRLRPVRPEWHDLHRLLELHPKQPAAYRGGRHCQPRLSGSLPAEMQGSR